LPRESRSRLIVVKSDASQFTEWCAGLHRTTNAADLMEKIMKLSARNQLKGKVTEVHKGATTAHVLIDLGHGVTITSSITNEAVDDLGLKVGDSVASVIKASDVMIAK